MHVPETSIAAYDEELSSGRIKGHKNRVYKAIERYPNLTAGEYARLCNWKKRETAARRISELKELGVIEVVFIRHCTAFPTKNKCECYRTNSNPFPYYIKPKIKHEKIPVNELIRLRAEAKRIPHLLSKIRHLTAIVQGQESFMFVN